MATQRRSFKVAEKIRMIVAEQLHRMPDPRFSLVTVTAATVGPDLRTAKIYWTVSGDKDRIEEVKEAFKVATGAFRKVLSKELEMKFVPEVKFFYDDTLDTSEEVERLLSKIRHQDDI